jgi:hypothetical protein
MCLRNLKLVCQRDTCTLTVTAAHPQQPSMDQSKCPVTDAWMKKMWYMYSGILRSLSNEETMPLGTTWMDLETTEPEWGKSNTEGQSTACSHLYMDSKTTKLLETESRMAVTPTEEGGRELTIRGHKILDMRSNLSFGGLLSHCTLNTAWSEYCTLLTQQISDMHHKNAKYLRDG